MNLLPTTTRSAATTLALLSGLLIAFGQCPAQSAEIPKKGVTPYVTHFVFRPVQNLDVSGLGTVTLLEATGTTENLKGEKMLDKMSARCEALASTRDPRTISTAPACSPTPTAT